MEPKLFCQSCTMPIDNMAYRGTEKDGSKSSDYCKYCYKDGAFTEPDITFEGMKKEILKQLQQMNLPKGIIEKSLENLPNLKRWKKVKV